MLKSFIENLLIFLIIGKRLKKLKIIKRKHKNKKKIKGMYNGGK